MGRRSNQFCDRGQPSQVNCDTILYSLPSSIPLHNSIDSWPTLRCFLHTVSKSVYREKDVKCRLVKLWVSGFIPSLARGRLFVPRGDGELGKLFEPKTSERSLEMFGRDTLLSRKIKSGTLIARLMLPCQTYIC